MLFVAAGGSCSVLNRSQCGYAYCNGATCVASACY
jgi:hypothetical protein